MVMTALIAGQENAEVCLTAGISKHQMTSVLDSALDLWREDKEFKYSYNAAVLMVKEHKHKFSIK